jgi:MtN3 and saliva related transmembrane protein
MVEILGFFAGLISMISFIPQVYKTYKTKSAESISLATFSIYTVAMLLWTVYGILIGRPSIYITNIFILIVSGIQVILKIKYSNSKCSNSGR